MKPLRTVITGGPGSGKTTLIKRLEDKGFTCLHEISRQVTAEAQKEGIEQLFLTNPLLFSQKLLEGRLKQFNQAEQFNTTHLFYDRGMPDVLAYMDYVDSHYPKNFVEICHKNQYDTIFILPPWEEIYEQDNERYESFAEAEKIFQYLKKGYEKFGYKVIEVPVGQVKNRIHYILNHLNLLD